MDVTVNVGEIYEDDIPAVPRGWTLFIEGSVDTSTVGVYTITYNARENATGRVVSTSRTVTVVESSSGSVTLNGDAVISIDLDDVATYVDAGATSSDGTVLVTNLDGTVSESFTGLPNIAGSYTLIYYTAGSFSNFVTRTIHVSDPNSGGGGGGGEPAPTLGPKNIAVEEEVIPVPTLGPQTVVSTLLPPAGPKDVEVYIPLPTTGPKTAELEHIAVTPATGYPIKYVFDGNPNTVVTPNVGFPIETVESDTADPTIPVKPNVGFPIETVESNTADPTVPVKPNVGFSIETVESNTADPTVPVKPNVGFPIETVESNTAEPTIPVKPNASYPIENLE